MPKNPKPRLT